MRRAAVARGVALVAPAALVALAACGRNEPPRLEVEDQRAAVNIEMVMALRVSDPNRDRLAVSFKAEQPGIDKRARIVEEKDGGYTFRWTPALSDLGEHRVTFRVNDGREEVWRNATITVSASEGQGAPVFVQPLGTGTTLDLARGGCLEVPVVVTDHDTPGVTLGQAEPLVENAELVQDSELAGRWTFCPTREQIASDTRYAVRLTADDFEHPTVIKDYLVVLLGDSGESCPGEHPQIEHSESDWSTVDDLVVSARVRDQEGLKFEPLLYYSLQDPGDPADVSQMVQLTMEKDSGSMTDGQWTGRIPNPVASGSAGDEARVWYVLAATDNDDVEGSCDHTVLAPAASAFSARVTNPGGAGSGELCEPCTADAQCGGPDDLCVAFGGEPTCFTACSGDSDCPGDYYCSASTFTSVDGAQGRQCLPDSLLCEDPVLGCSDDGSEDNDDLFSATSLSLGTHALASCPLDEDWYEVHLSSEGELEVLLDGGLESDLDLALYDWWGLLLDQSDSLSSLEAAGACVPAGDYLVRVHATGEAENAYTLDLTHTPGSCGATCTDDGSEPDDDVYDATPVDLGAGPFEDQDLQICPLDEDWYQVYLYAGEELWVTASFLQDTPAEDLDLMVLDQDGYILLGCTEDDPSYCDPANGQDGDSHETLGMAVETAGFYYVIVRGWDGAANQYDLCIGLSWVECP